MSSNLLPPGGLGILEGMHTIITLSCVNPDCENFGCTWETRGTYDSGTWVFDNENDADCRYCGLPGEERA